MKYFVNVPIIGYASMFVETEQASLSQIKAMIVSGELELQTEPCQDPIEEYMLVDALSHDELPESWPAELQVSLNTA